MQKCQCIRLHLSVNACANFWQVVVAAKNSKPVALYCGLWWCCSYRRSGMARVNERNHTVSPATRTLNPQTWLSHTCHTSQPQNVTVLWSVFIFHPDGVEGWVGPGGCLHTAYMSPLLFDNRWTDRNADCCVNTVDEKIPTAKNLVQ